MNDNKGKQLLAQTDHEITVTMSGDSIQDITGKIFQGMRRQIFKEFDQPIIHLEAQEVYFEKVEKHTQTEKFMLFFWPREKVTYTITAKIVVRIKYLDYTEEER